MEPTTNRTFPEISGVFISIATAVAYAMAFAFEAGYAGAFGMSWDMIELQLIPTIFNMLIALSVIWSLLTAVDPMISFFKLTKTDNPIVKAILPALATLFVGVVLWQLTQPLPWLTILGGLVVVIIVAATQLVIFPYMESDAPRGYMQRLRHSQQPRVFNHTSLSAVVLADHNRKFLWTVVTLIFAITLSAAAGFGRGHRERDFFVTNLEPETIVLRIYGNRAVAAEFVRAEKRIKPVYRFLRLDESGLTLRLERVGPITYTEGKATN